LNFVLIDDEAGWHIYRAPAPARTLCDRPVRAAERGWSASGRPADDPAFPLRLCPDCKAAPERKVIEAEDAAANAADHRTLAEKLRDAARRMGFDD